ncbi:MAG: peptidase M10 [Bacteroidota bacterium]
MGQAELIPQQHLLLINSILFLYGNAATDELSKQIARNIQQHWNEGEAFTIIKHKKYKLMFDIKGIHAKDLTPAEVFENTDPKNNYFRIEETSPMEVSFVDGIGCNTGYFLLNNLLQDSTTAAHEYGHTLGLIHPHELDIRGRGVPGIMYPRGTVVDARHQYNPNAIAGDNTNGGTMNPFSRKVLQQDIDNLKLHKLSFDKNGFAVVGEFSSLWHEAYE